MVPPPVMRRLGEIQFLQHRSNVTALGEDPVRVLNFPNDWLRRMPHSYLLVMMITVFLPVKASRKRTLINFGPKNRFTTPPIPVRIGWLFDTKGLGPSGNASVLRREIASENFKRSS